MVKKRYGLNCGNASEPMRHPSGPAQIRASTISVMTSDAIASHLGTSRNDPAGGAVVAAARAFTAREFTTIATIARATIVNPGKIAASAYEVGSHADHNHSR